MPIPLLTRSLGLLALVPLLALTACGGGGGGGSPGTSTLTFVPSTDLTLQSNGTVNGAPGILVGEAGGFALFGGVRFPLFPFLDATDTILSAKLRVKQGAVVQFPYVSHGNVIVDYVDFGVTLSAGDNVTTVLTANVGTLSSDATLGYKEIDVTAQVIAAAAANDFTVDFFLRFSALTVGVPDDNVAFEDVEGGLGTPDRPELVVTYQ